MEYIARSSNGRTTVSGTVYLGSSPSLAVLNSREKLREESDWYHFRLGLEQRSHVLIPIKTDELVTRQISRVAKFSRGREMYSWSMSRTRSLIEKIL